jgi:hypothetical protein
MQKVEFRKMEIQSQPAQKISPHLNKQARCGVHVYNLSYVGSIGRRIVVQS